MTTEEKIIEDLNNGKFYSICSNETTFKNYTYQKLQEHRKQVLEEVKEKIENHYNNERYTLTKNEWEDLLQTLIK